MGGNSLGGLAAVAPSRGGEWCRASPGPPANGAATLELGGANREGPLDIAGMSLTLVSPKICWTLFFLGNLGNWCGGGPRGKGGLGAAGQNGAEPLVVPTAINKSCGIGVGRAPKI